VNEKNIIYCLAFVFILLFCGIFAGCQSQPNVPGPAIIQSAASIGKLQEQNRQLTELTNNLVAGIESIENRISNIQSGIESAQTNAVGAEQDIDRAIKLFIEYKSRVDQFLNDYRKLQNQIEHSN
jgi:chromosome segregation ATPase